MTNESEISFDELIKKYNELANESHKLMIRHINYIKCNVVIYNILMVMWLIITIETTVKEYNDNDLAAMILRPFQILFILFLIMCLILIFNVAKYPEKPKYISVDTDHESVIEPVEDEASINAPNDSIV